MEAPSKMLKCCWLDFAWNGEDVAAQKMKKIAKHVSIAGFSFVGDQVVGASRAAFGVPGFAKMDVDLPGSLLAILLLPAILNNVE